MVRVRCGLDSNRFDLSNWFSIVDQSLKGFNSSSNSILSLEGDIIVETAVQSYSTIIAFRVCLLYLLKLKKFLFYETKQNRIQKVSLIKGSFIVKSGTPI